jgi:hypothetical protein
VAPEVQSTPVPVPTSDNILTSVILAVFGFIGGLVLLLIGLAGLYSLNCPDASAVDCTLNFNTPSVFAVAFGTLGTALSSVWFHRAVLQLDLMSFFKHNRVPDRAGFLSPTTPPASAGSPSGSRPCPYCGTGNRSDFAFCFKCGKPLPPQ